MQRHLTVKQLITNFNAIVKQYLVLPVSILYFNIFINASSVPTKYRHVLLYVYMHFVQIIIFETAISFMKRNKNESIKPCEYEICSLKTRFLNR